MTNVSITPDGTYALVRSDTQASIAAYHLADGTRTDIPLPDVATDLALTADGTEAVAVVRSQGVVALIQVPGGLAAGSTPTLISVDTFIGSVVLAPQSTVAFFYTNATPSNILTTMDLSVPSPTPTATLVRAPILAVYPSDDAAYALVQHDALTTVDTTYQGAVSIVPAALGFPPALIGLDAPVISLAMAHAGDHAVVAAGDDTTGTYRFVVASMPALTWQTFNLASLPISAGIVEGAGKAYVAQDYADGRITFVDLNTLEAHTLTGFELATQVVDGTK